MIFLNTNHLLELLLGLDELLELELILELDELELLLGLDELLELELILELDDEL